MNTTTEKAIVYTVRTVVAAGQVATLVFMGWVAGHLLQAPSFAERCIAKGGTPADDFCVVRSVDGRIHRINP